MPYFPSFSRQELNIPPRNELPYVRHTKRCSLEEPHQSENIEFESATPTGGRIYLLVETTIAVSYGRFRSFPPVVDRRVALVMVSQDQFRVLRCRGPQATSPTKKVGVAFLLPRYVTKSTAVIV